MHSRIVGTGSYLPAQVLTKHELAKRVDTSDAWIRARTGIRERRIAAPAEMTSDLALAASRRAWSSWRPWRMGCSNAWQSAWG